MTNEELLAIEEDFFCEGVNEFASNLARFVLDRCIELDLFDAYGFSFVYDGRFFDKNLTNYDDFVDIYGRKESAMKKGLGQCSDDMYKIYMSTVEFIRNSKYKDVPVLWLMKECHKRSPYDEVFSLLGQLSSYVTESFDDRCYVETCLEYKIKETKEDNEFDEKGDLIKRMNASFEIKENMFVEFFIYYLKKHAENKNILIDFFQKTPYLAYDESVNMLHKHHKYEIDRFGRQFTTCLYGKSSEELKKAISQITSSNYKARVLYRLKKTAVFFVLFKDGWKV